MKKIYSLIKACMTNDMNIFKFRTKNNGKKTKIAIPLLLTMFVMFTIWSNANMLFEKIAFTNMQYIILSMAVFSISIMTIIEGIYKSGSLIFNCKDDQLLLSLPLKKETVLFVRIFKFYVFELLFNSLFLLPVMFAYIRWADNLSYTYFITSVVMIFMLPIIPIVISSLLGIISSSISSRFKYKNKAQIIISMFFLLLVFYISFNSGSIFNYLIKHATSLNDLIMKIYYPAGIYSKLIVNFNVIDLLVFILINLVILFVGIFLLSRFYFKINSRLKKVVTSKKYKLDNIKIKSRSIYRALIKKELNTFFDTPVFIINAGFGLILFIVASVIILFKFDIVISFITESDGINLSKDIIMSNLSILIFILISFTSYMTSITNSVISLEGRSINILKSLPIKTKTILMSKVCSSLLLTTPVLLLGDILLFIKFKIGFIELLLLLILSILIPLVSHFVGLIVNLKFPKLDAENSTEVVKQSMSSFISVMIGMLLFILSMFTIMNVIGHINSTWILFFAVLIYLLLDLFLYFYLNNVGVVQFNRVSI